MSQILHLLRFAQPVATALATLMKRPPQKLCALLGLPLAMALSSCQPCTLIGCAPGLSVVISMTNADNLPPALYELQVNDGGFIAVGRCQISDSAPDCLLSMPPTETTYNGKRIEVSFWGHAFTADSLPFVLTVDGATRKTGSLPVSYITSQPNGPHCGDCVDGSATLKLP